MATIGKAKRVTARPRPKWKLERRKCLNDNRLFLPKLQRQRFCSDSCRKEFHRYGANYGPIKMGLERALGKKYELLEKELKKQARIQRDQSAIDIKTVQFQFNGLIERMEALEDAIKPLLVGREQAEAKHSADGGQ